MDRKNRGSDENSFFERSRRAQPIEFCLFTLAG